MHMHKTYIVSMGKAWSINSTEFYQWVRKQLTEQNEEAKDDDIFCFNMEGWRELRRQPAWWMVRKIGSDTTVGCMKSLLGEYHEKKDQ